jgi:uncharacterized protein YydD (DUF2326 family)
VSFKIDNESEPGAWQREMEKAPWRFRDMPKSIEEALDRMKSNNNLQEYYFLLTEISQLRAEIARLSTRSDRNSTESD